MRGHLKTETKVSSFWRNLCHWLHRKLSKWQISVQPVTKISSKWQHIRISEWFTESSPHDMIPGFNSIPSNDIRPTWPIRATSVARRCVIFDVKFYLTQQTIILRWSRRHYEIHLYSYMNLWAEGYQYERLFWNDMPTNLWWNVLSRFIV